MRAAYRFLAQDQLDWQDILQPHWEATAQRMRQLSLPDTTSDAVAPRVPFPLRATRRDFSATDLDRQPP